MDTPNINTDVLSSDTEATSSVVNDTPPIEIIDLTDDIEDEIIATDDWDGMYKRSLAMRQIFPSLDDNTKWTGKWKLKPNNWPSIDECKELASCILYTDEEIDWDNWMAAVNLAIGKISQMNKLLAKLDEKLRARKVRESRSCCHVDGQSWVSSGYGECTRCHKKVPLNMVSGKPHDQLCFPQKMARFHPYIKRMP